MTDKPEPRDRAGSGRRWRSDGAVVAVLTLAFWLLGLYLLTDAARVIRLDTALWGSPTVTTATVVDGTTAISTGRGGSKHTFCASVVVSFVAGDHDVRVRLDRSQLRDHGPLECRSMGTLSVEYDPGNPTRYVREEGVEPGFQTLLLIVLGLGALCVSVVGALFAFVMLLPDRPGGHAPAVPTPLTPTSLLLRASGAVLVPSALLIALLSAPADHAVAAEPAAAPGESGTTGTVAPMRAIRDSVLLQGHDLLNGVAFSPDGTTLAAGGFGREILLWDIRTRVVTTTIPNDDWARDVVFSPDGKLIATSAYHNDVHLWNLPAGTARKPLVGHTDSVLSVAFGPDGATLASGSVDGTVRIWDMATSTTKATLTSRMKIASVAFSADGRLVAAGGNGWSVQIWEVATGRPVMELTGQTDTIRGLDFNPRTTMLVTASQKKTQIWDIGTGKVVTTLREHTGPVTSARFSPAGTTLATGATDGTVRIWDVATGRPVATCLGAASVDSVAFSPDDKILAVDDGTKARLWNLE